LKGILLSVKFFCYVQTRWSFQHRFNLPRNSNTSNSEICQSEDTGVKAQTESLPKEIIENPDSSECCQLNSTLSKDQARSDLTPLASFNPSQRTFQMANLPNPPGICRLPNERSTQDNLARNPKKVLQQLLSSLNTGKPEPDNNNKIATNSLVERIQINSGQDGTYENSTPKNTNSGSFGSSQSKKDRDSEAFLKKTGVQDVSQETNKVFLNATSYTRPELLSTDSRKSLPNTYPQNPLVASRHSSEYRGRSSTQNRFDYPKPGSGTWQDNFRSQSTDVMKKVFSGNLHQPSLRDTSTADQIPVKFYLVKFGSKIFRPIFFATGFHGVKYVALCFKGLSWSATGSPRLKLSHCNI
jgi:hypothetical protein